MTITVNASNLIDYDTEVQRLLDIYSATNIPIEISFKELLPQLNKADRVTHLIHTYPAKLLMHIPFFFLNNNIFSKKGDLILDPFCGSGTVILEAILAGRRGFGADANPLARIISKVKTFRFDIELLRIYSQQVYVKMEQLTGAPKPFVCNIDYWFLPQVQNSLSIIAKAIDDISNPNYRDFFLVCFSNCVKKVSLADPRVTVPVKLRLEQYSESHPLYNTTKRKLENVKNINVYAKFKEIVEANVNRAENFNLFNSYNFCGEIISNDARSLNNNDTREKTDIALESINLIITSPPYAGAQKYIRSSSLNLGWLNFIGDSNTLKDLENKNIGREHYPKDRYKYFTPTNISSADILLKEIFNVNPLRALIAGNYLIEMREAFRESIKHLKPGGYFVLVAANNVVCKKEFKTQEYLMEIMEELNMKVILRLIDDIKSYGLMTKRNKTANIITREWVLVFQKPIN